jgi:putative toxin-antitoxin system antitoxin component (TIGR02293 family)
MASEQRRQEADNESGKLQEQLGWSAQQMAAFLVLSPNDYAERLRTNHWLSAETERLQLLERAFSEASRVFRDDDKAGKWLDSPIISMCNRRPADQLKAAGGLELVLETLAKIEYGMF